VNSVENWVFIPVCGGLAMTKRTVQSVLAQDIGNIRILLADDASQDSVSPWLRTLYHQYPNVQTIGSVTNMGPTYWWNVALDWLFSKEQVPYVLVLNSDLWLSPATYRLLVEDGGGFVTGISVDTMKATENVNPSSKSPHPSFSCFLIRREVWERVGRFNPDMVIYAQDCDYHLRMDREGIDAYSIDVPFYHEVSGTMKQADNKRRDAIQARADKDRLAFKNKWGYAIASPEYEQAFRHSKVSK
jgi:GT2 family glycosyltransferase